LQSNNTVFFDGYSVKLNSISIAYQYTNTPAHLEEYWKGQLV